MCDLITFTVSFMTEIKCPPLKSPVNGEKLSQDAVVDSIVTFKCYDGYKLSRLKGLICQEDGNWNALEPLCSGTVKCCT